MVSKYSVIYTTNVVDDVYLLQIHFLIQAIAFMFLKTIGSYNDFYEVLDSLWVKLSMQEIVFNYYV